MANLFKRHHFQIIRARLLEPRRFIQVLAGPRQTGKTTLVHQIENSLPGSVHYASADDPALQGRTWIEQQWESARIKALEAGRSGIILVLDEIQKIPGWSETVKRLWDEDTRRRVVVKTVLLGSAPLLVQQGLSESLAGRFELIHVDHWSFDEMQKAFGWTVDQYIYFGGYPGSAGLIDDPARWKKYVSDAFIETTLARDILLMNRVDKPALLRQLFHLGCAYSGQVLSYQKMLGQLHDAGNTTTLSHYLELLSGAGMVTGLHKYSGKLVRQRASSPKLLVLNTALMSAQSSLGFEETRLQTDVWGRFVESCVGAHLVNALSGTPIKVWYWREESKEVDFVLQHGRSLVLIEVKSGRSRDTFSGSDQFDKLYHPLKKILVGENGIPLDIFLRTPISDLLEKI